MNILIIEDDEFLSMKIKSIFENKILANRVKTISNFKYFLYEYHMINSYDIILVDIILSDSGKNNGIDILKLIRKKNKSIPIIVLSGLDDLLWLKKAFDEGANDYISKPFRLAELELRIFKWFKMFLSGKYNSVSNHISYKNLVYNFDNRLFYFNGKELNLTKLNKYVLFLFVSNNEKLLTEGFLENKIWGDIGHMVDRNIRVVISRLKKSLEPYYLDSWIQNVRGEGYIFKED